MLASRLAPLGLVLALATACGRDPLLSAPFDGAANAGHGGSAAGGTGAVSGTGGTGGSAGIDGAVDGAGDGGDDLGPSDATLLLVPGAGVPLPVGQSLEWKAIVLVGGSRRDVTLDPDTLWQIDDASIASVAPRSGRVTGLQPGTTTVRVSYPQLAGASAVLTVTAAQVESVAVTPALLSVAAGETKPLAASAAYSDGTRADVTDAASWASDDQRIARVGNGVELPGQVTGAGAGQTMVTATFAGKSGTAAVMVSGTSEVTMAISPSTLIRALNATARFQAITRQSNGATGDVSSVASWSSSDSNAAIPFGGGQFRCAASATVTITAQYMGLSADALLTCGSAAQIVGLRLSPAGANSTLLVGSRYRLELDAVYSDMTVMRVSSGARIDWTSSDESVATIDDSGLLAATRAGTVTITAVYGGVTGMDTYTFQ